MSLRNGLMVRLVAPVLALSAILSLAAGRCEADLVLRIEPTVAAPGGLGAFDVYLEVQSGSYNVSSFSFGLEVAAGSGITFTGATPDPQSAAYIFGALQSSDFTFTTFPSWNVIAGDALFTAPGSVSLTTGDVVGLGRVAYAIAAGTPAGDVTVSFLLTGETEILDALGAPLAFDVAPAAITVASPGVIPEPSSLAMLALAVAPLLALSLRRSR